MKRENTVGYAVRNLNNLLKRSVDKSAVKQQLDNMTGMHGWVIGYLYDHKERDIFQKDFEEAFNIRRSTAAEIMKVMEKNGLITRTPALHDKRLRKIVLTEKSIQCHEAFSEHIHNFEQALVDGISQNELDVFFRVVKRITENIEAVDK